MNDLKKYHLRKRGNSMSKDTMIQDLRLLVDDIDNTDYNTIEDLKDELIFILNLLIKIVSC